MPLGSSPLTRGKRGSPNDYQRCPGLIPAHAGKTPGRSSSLPCCWAHPRSRGENFFNAHARDSTLGSSPLTRGKPLLAPHAAAHTGLIPAHAGKTYLSPTPDANATAHPRSRGENGANNFLRSIVQGSSPLTRGKQVPAVGLPQMPGLIPAHAGKTCSTRHTSPHEGAHPRSRGENLFDKTHVTSRRGSSPLTRGKLGHPAHAHRPPGLIPAHAGKTSSLSWYHLSQRAHPRSRGENQGLPPPGWPVGGSSPLTRGKPTHHDAKAANHRAHPRSRGENSCTPALIIIGRGSSPLTRGKLPPAKLVW